MELSVQLKYSHVLSHQQIQSMKILQMTHQELTEYVGEAVLDNPVLFADEVHSKNDNPELLHKYKWLEAEDRQNRYYNQYDKNEQLDPLINIPAPFIEESLINHIDEQLSCMRISKTLYNASHFVAANLDENGYLRDSLLELAISLGVPYSLIKQAALIVRSLNPAGIGAVNLRDCLDIQLVRMENTELARKIVVKYLNNVSKNQYCVIAKALEVSLTEVIAAVNLIRTLNPKPGAAFTPSESTTYIHPDIIVIRNNDSFEIFMDETDVTLKISSFYYEMMMKSHDEELRNYLDEKMRKAKWLIDCLEQRKATVIKCTRSILEVQGAFFRGETNVLAPLTMADVASLIDVHESTVSRAVRGKYLQSDKGIFSLRYFFSRSLGENDTSVNHAKRILQSVISAEDALKPISDQKIVERMRECGIDISRRTVAKYRSELNIPNASGRKNRILSDSSIL